MNSRSSRRVLELLHTLARPKSSTLMRPSGATSCSPVSGLDARRLFRAPLRALPQSDEKDPASRRSRAASRAIRSDRVSPSTSSRIRYSRIPFDLLQFVDDRDVGDDSSEASTCASRSNRASRSESCAKASGSALIATSRPSFVSRPRYTSPMPPAPMAVWISYGPRRVPGASATAGFYAITLHPQTTIMIDCVIVATRYHRCAHNHPRVAKCRSRRGGGSGRLSPKDRKIFFTVDCECPGRGRQSNRCGRGLPAPQRRQAPAHAKGQVVFLAIPAIMGLLAPRAAQGLSWPMWRKSRETSSLDPGGGHPGWISRGCTCAGPHGRSIADSGS